MNDTNPWVDETTPVVPEKKTKSKLTAPVVEVKQEFDAEYDIDGLMTDFPTANLLERFVYDETGIVLNLKGRANKLKYQVAMDVLNRKEVDLKFIGSENPYIDRNDMVPTEPLLPIPPRDPSLPPNSEVQNIFLSHYVPHPDNDFRARGKKVICWFKKYKNGVISYEIMGPLDQVAHGTKIDKYGRERPEVIKWVNPRTGEQTIMREDGTLTPVGRRLRSMMMSLKVNKSNQWDVWVDREFGQLNQGAISNPWDLK